MIQRRRQIKTILLKLSLTLVAMITPLIEMENKKSKQ
jgi:hypothetical protein